MCIRDRCGADRPAGQSGGEGEIFGGGQPRFQGVLMAKQSDAGSVFGSIRQRIAVIPHQPARVRPDQPGEHPQQR